MIKRGIERSLHCGRSVKLNARQLIAPHLLRPGTHLVEVESGHFGVHVLDRVLFAHRRKRHLHNERSRGRRKTEHSLQSPSLYALSILRRCSRRFEAVVGWRIFFLVVKGMARHRGGESHREEQLPSGRPSAGLAHSRHGAIRMYRDARPQHLTGIVVDAAAQVEQHVTLCAFGKCVAMYTDTLAGGQLRAYSRVLKEHSVIAWLRDFAGVRKTRAIPRLGLLDIPGFKRDIVTAYRHKEYIAKITVPRTGEMRMREAEDGCVFVAISGCPLVALLEWPNLRVGRELHHAERRGRSRKSMPFRPGADHRINKLDGVGCLCERNRGRNQHSK